MPKTWKDVEQSQEFQALSPQDKIIAKKQYFNNVVSSNPQYSSLNNENKMRAKHQFFGGSLVSEMPESEFSSNVVLDTAVGTGKVIGKSASDLASSLVQPIMHPVQTIKGVGGIAIGGAEKLIPGRQKHEVNIEALGDFLKSRYGNVDKIADTVATDPFGFVSDVVAAAGVVGGASQLAGKVTGIQSLKNFGSAPYSAKKIKSAKDLAVKGATKIKAAPGKAISNARDYAANKVNAIRKGFWDEYAPKEYSAYEQAINDLPNDFKGKLSGADLLQNIEKTMIDRQLITPEGKLLRPLSSADSRFVKAYETVYKKWASSADGMVDATDFVNEYKTIRGKYTGKPTQIQRANIEAANNFFNSAADQINTEGFTKAKFRYRKFKENQELINQAVDLYGSEAKTGRGERWLTEGAINKTAQGRKTAQMITERTGQGLKGAKTITRINQINPVRLLMR